MYTTVKEVLLNSTTDEHTLRLPDCQLDRKLYLDVKKALEMAAGKWKSGKIQGFVFPLPALSVIREMTKDDVSNPTKLKKEFQFFATPREIADKMAELLCLQDNDKVLEPSAGHGVLIEAVHDCAINDMRVVFVDWCEIYPLSQQLVMNRKFQQMVCFREYDFFNLSTDNKYDAIIANPPFTKNADIDFVMKMYDHLEHGGRLVTLMSTHYENSSNKKEKQFAAFLDDVNASVERIPAKAFQSSGTNIETLLIKIVRG